VQDLGRDLGAISVESSPDALAALRVKSAPDKGSLFHAILLRYQGDGDAVKESAAAFSEIGRI